MYTCFKLLSAKHVPLRQLNVRWRQPHDKNWISTNTCDINNSQGGCSGSTNSFGGMSGRLLWRAMSWFAMLKGPWQMLQPAWPAPHPSTKLELYTSWFQFYVCQKGLYLLCLCFCHFNKNCFFKQTPTILS